MSDTMRDKVREALERALVLLGELMSYDAYLAYPPNLAERVEEFIAPFDAAGIDAALSSPEQGERDRIARAALWDALYDLRYPARSAKDEDEIAYAADVALGLDRSNDPWGDIPPATPAPEPREA